MTWRVRIWSSPAFYCWPKVHLGFFITFMEKSKQTFCRMQIPTPSMNRTQAGYSYLAFRTWIHRTMLSSRRKEVHLDCVAGNCLLLQLLLILLLSPPPLMITVNFFVYFLHVRHCRCLVLKVLCILSLQIFYKAHFECKQCYHHPIFRDEKTETLKVRGCPRWRTVI